MFAKKSWVATKLEAWSKTRGLCPPGPDLKPPLMPDDACHGQVDIVRKDYIFNFRLTPERIL